MRDLGRFRSALWTALLLPFLFLPYRWSWLPCALAATMLIASPEIPVREIFRRHGTVIVGSVILLIVRSGLDPLWWGPWIAFLAFLTAWRSRYRLGRSTTLVMVPIVWLAACVSLNGMPNLLATSTAAVPPGQLLVCAGDSLTSGVDIRSDTATYVAALRDRLPCPVINAGFANDKTRDLLKRLDKDVLSRGPTVVAVFIGGNDYLDGTPRAQFAEYLEQVVGRIAATNARVVLVEVPTGIVWNPYAGIYRRVAARHGAILVPETRLRLWFSAELLARDHLAAPLTIDGIHLSPAGAKRVADWLEPYVLQALAEARPRAGASAPG